MFQLIICIKLTNSIRGGLINFKTILLVDDEPMLRDLISEEIIDNGFNCLIASGGNEAIELLKIHPIDLIVSDVKMQNGDGLHMLKELNKLETISPRVLFLSGSVEKSIAEEALSLGAIAVLRKPLDLDELINLIQLNTKQAA